MKRVLTSIFLAVCAAFFFCAGGFLTFAENCEDVCSEVLRLHIPANSDSEADQAIKMKLRDIILREFSGELSECGKLDEAEKKARGLLPEIERKSTEFLERNCFSYGAKAELVTMDFTTREYDKLILPAGRYRAIRITLGSGEGHNWWCVIFPQLCLPAACEIENTENAEEVLANFGKPQGITIKFAVFEWFQHLFG